jgi:hypothetical protein
MEGPILISKSWHSLPARQDDGLHQWMKMDFISRLLAVRHFLILKKK